MPTTPARCRTFLRAETGFTGAEKALLICFGLAIIGLVSFLISAGGEKAGGDAAKTLAQGRGSLSSASRLGKIMSAGDMPTAGGSIKAPGPVQRPGAISKAAPVALPRPAPAAPAAPTPLPDGQKDVAYDGAFVGAGGKAYPRDTPIDRVPPVVPSDGRKPNGTILYVNGIRTDKGGQYTSLQDLANTTGAQVIGIHNATEGFKGDIAQSIKDKANIGDNPAVDQAADAIYNAIKQGQPIHVIGHSQGGLILSRALRHVRQRLIAEDKLTGDQATAKLGLVQVETFGAAAGSYPDGPQYVHYVNRGDPVPDLFGLGPFGSFTAGKGAKTIRFNKFKLNPIDAHSFDDVYLPRRIPFDQARNGK